MRGILLAGGSGTRMGVIAKMVSKQLLPVFDKPMIYYPLATLMRAGIREILVISTPRDTPLIHALLQDGRQWGLELSYAVQQEPRGIAEALLIGEDFIGNQPVCLILGDNLFIGNIAKPFPFAMLGMNNPHLVGLAHIFVKNVLDAKRFGVVEFDDTGRKVVSIVEKPLLPKSHGAVTGLYLYSHGVAERAKELQPSIRGELEITDLNNSYLRDGLLSATKLSDDVIWMDCGTPEALLQASKYVHSYQLRRGPVADLDAIALKMGRA